jgi:hypothetical protein
VLILTVATIKTYTMKVAQSVPLYSFRHNIEDNTLQKYSLENFKIEERSG